MMQAPSTPSPARTVSHGALALIRQRDLVQARLALATPDLTAEQRQDAARTLAEKGNAADRMRGAAILTGAKGGAQ